MLIPQGPDAARFDHSLVRAATGGNQSHPSARLEQTRICVMRKMLLLAAA
jgi:hypothetical protein